MSKYVSLAEDRVHSIYRYTDQIYKVVQWYRMPWHFGPGPRENQKHYDNKLASSLSRARSVILEKALCNSWDWFCTLTISKDKFDRKDLAAWQARFTQWVRDYRKKGYPVQYLLVPERHKDGSWHAHGLLAGLPDEVLISFKKMHESGYRSSDGRPLPKRLRSNDYYNWPAYQENFGFCSLGRIRVPVAAGFYITKYITKEHDRMVSAVGLHSYYCSQGLNRAVKHLDYFGRDPYLEMLLVNKYDYCATGMTHLEDGLDWTFGFDLVPFCELKPLDLTEPELEADGYYEFEQLVLDMKR